MPIIDKIQLSGTVYTIGNETTTAVTSASTDNEIPTAKAVYDAIQEGGGGSITIDPSLDSGSTNPVANSAITTAINAKQDTLVSSTNIKTINNESILGSGNITIEGGGGMTEDDELLLSTALVDLNDRKADKSLLGNYQMKGDYVTTNTLNTRLAEYETALDEQNVEEVTAYALNDLNNKFGGLSLVKITESAYSALTTKDENTLYIVVADPS